MTSSNIKILLLLLWGFFYMRTDSSLCTLGCLPLPTSGCSPGQPWAEGITLPHHSPPGMSVPTAVVKGKRRQTPSSCSACVSPSALSFLYATAPLWQGVSCTVCLHFAWPGRLWARLGSWTSNWLDAPRSSNPFSLLITEKKDQGKELAEIWALPFPLPLPAG